MGSDLGRIIRARTLRACFLLWVLGSTAGLSVRADNLPSLRIYATRPGETRDIELDAGNVAHLNTRTHMERADEAKRLVVLREGEAYFELSTNPAHPFRVELPGSVILAQASRFDVYRKADGEVVITVLDGFVQIEGYRRRSDRIAWRRELRAGQQMVYRAKDPVDEARTVDAATTIKWREGMLEIKDEPLPAVIEELQRYTDRRLVIRDWRLRQWRMGGILTTRDVRAALARLEKLAPIVVTERGDTFALDYRVGFRPSPQ